MERVSSGSNLPRPSAISRLPRPGIANIPDKPLTAQAPSRYSLNIPRTRPRALPAGNEAFISQSVKESQEIEDSEPPPKLIDGKVQETSLEPIKIENAREKKDAEDLVGKTPVMSRRASRLTLADRTVETLSHIPPSPSPRRRKSNFFPTEPPTSSLSRPSSSLSRSRPSTSTGMYPPPPPNFSTPRRPSPMKHQSETINNSSSVKPLQNRRSVSSFVPKSAPRSQIRPLAPIDTTPSKPPVPKLSNEMLSKWSTQKEGRVVKNGANFFGKQSISNSRISQISTKGSVANHSAKSMTYAPKTTKQRPSVDNVFSQSPSPQPTDDLKRRVSASPRKMIRTLPAKSTEVSSTSSIRTVSSPLIGLSSPLAAPESPKSSPKSSTTLRETIAKAKAARRNALKSNGNHPNMTDKNNHELQSDFVGDGGFFGDVAEAAKVLHKRIEMARTTGKLNISALGLKKLPKEINEMYNLDSIASDQGEWYESVDLVRMVAADNELDVLDEWAFPDFTVEAAQSLDDDFGGSIFRGLETLDLHGNRLLALPQGLRRLERLVTLNMSKNRLGNESLDLLCQMSSLRELRLNENRLEGILPDSFRNLKNLEVLELRDNAITSIATVLEDLTSIRVLVVAGNKLTSMPFELLQSLPLLELDAARNRLDGILIPQGVKGFSNLRYLNVSHNALTWILEDEYTKLPSLQVLNVSENRLVDLPKLSDWPDLITLSAGNNKITSLPEGLTSLEKLCNLDLACNNLKSLDSEIGLMKSLISLRVANNPLRERRFLTMATEDIKNELRNRILPPEPEPQEASNTNEISSRNSSPTHPSKKTWPITGGGILDRSSTNLETITASNLEHLLNSTVIKSLILHHNALTEIPSSIALLENSLISLDVSHNRLSASQSFISITSPLSLPHLTTLSIASNALSNLSPLLTSLRAPNLQTLTIANNRISSLPPLRQAFPCLSSILAADNCIEDVEVENVRGLRVLDLTGNEISHLKPELGLLEAEGLREFLVANNRFKVPRREVVERGTGAVMAWLRSKVVES